MSWMLFCSDIYLSIAIDGHEYMLVNVFKIRSTYTYKRVYPVSIEHDVHFLFTLLFTYDFSFSLFFLVYWKWLELSFSSPILSFCPMDIVFFFRSDHYPIDKCRIIMIALRIEFDTFKKKKENECLWSSFFCFIRWKNFIWPLSTIVLY